MLTLVSVVLALDLTVYLSVCRSERAVCNAVAPSKDVDGFHLTNVGRFCTDLKSLLPATPAGVMELIRRSGSCETVRSLTDSVLTNIDKY